jgi:hypothetical protein
MPVYRKFDRHDLASSTVHTTPRTSVTYGQDGWRGNTGVSGSLSLYGGVRSNLHISDQNVGVRIFPIDPVDTHTVDKIVATSGSYPLTGSIGYYRCYNAPRGSVVSTTVTVSSSVSASHLGHALDAYTMALWKLDELTDTTGALDSSGNNRHLGITGGGSPTVINGQIDNARSFAVGSNKAFISASDAQFLNHTISGALSVEFWVYPRPAGAGGEVFLCNGPGFTLNPGDTITLQLELTGDSQHFRVNQWQSNSSNTAGSTSALTVSTWNHVGVTRSARSVGGSHTFKVYVNGVLSTTDTLAGIDASITGSVSAATHYSCIGCYRDLSGPTVASSIPDADLDDIRFSSVERSAAEILDSYNRGIHVTTTTSSSVSQATVQADDWGDEHFRPIELLYSYYENVDPGYFLGTHDYYSVLIQADPISSPANWRAPFFVFSGSFLNCPITSASSSFTAEAWIKTAYILDPSSSEDTSSWNPTVMSQKGIWALCVTNDHLNFIAGNTSNIGTGSYVAPGEWTHVAATISGSFGSLFVNGNQTDTFVLGAPLATGSDALPLLVGITTDSANELFGGFNGFIHETRVWNGKRTAAQISSSYDSTLINSSSLDLLHYARFNDGPLSTAHGFSAGSGSFDYSPRAKHGYLFPYSSGYTVHWQPNDNQNFVTLKTRKPDVLDEIRVIHIPSLYYGRQIATGSVRLVTGEYNSNGIVRTFVDDGRGNLYVSGSMTRDISGEEYVGNTWRKVGNVFYVEGLIVLTDPALRDTFDSGSYFWDETVTGSFQDLLGLDFKGHNRINTKTLMCRLSPGQFNASNNPTFTELLDRGPLDPGDDRLFLRSDEPVTYITSIGVYNEERKLVAVAKLAQPIRKREKDKIDIRLKMDF